MEHELIWHYPVITYLYLAGLGAGSVVISCYSFLSSTEYGEDGHYHYFRMARYGALLGPVALIIGVSLLVFELGRWDRALNLFKVINLSPMSIGSWILLVFISTSLIYGFTFLPSLKPQYEQLTKRLYLVQHVLALINIPLGICVAVYTGILLGAVPSRPLWNSPILALLFLVSALSTGIATIILLRSIFHPKKPDAKSDQRVRSHGRRTAKRPGRRYHETGYLLATTDLVLIGVELIVIFLFIMFAHLTVGNLKYAMAMILPGGDMADMFWIWVVLVGLVLPALIELYTVIPRLIYNVSFVSHRYTDLVISIGVLIGGFMLRYVIVVAGQITGPMGI